MEPNTIFYSAIKRYYNTDEDSAGQKSMQYRTKQCGTNGNVIQDKTVQVKQQCNTGQASARQIIIQYITRQTAVQYKNE